MPRSRIELELSPEELQQFDEVVLRRDTQIKDAQDHLISIGRTDFSRTAIARYMLRQRTGRGYLPSLVHNMGHQSAKIQIARDLERLSTEQLRVVALLTRAFVLSEERPRRAAKEAKDRLSKQSQTAFESQSDTPISAPEAAGTDAGPSDAANAA